MGSNPADNRRLLVLRAVIHEYLETAEPVASGIIADKHVPGVSPATIRNDMAELEAAGYLEQPHTSAGRVPTEKGYRLYVQELVERDRRAAHFERSFIDRLAAAQEEADRNARDIAKTMAAATDEAVVVRLPLGSAHIAGLANLVRKPEFRESEVLYSLTQMLDEMDELLTDVFPRLSREVQVLIGSENPFSQNMSSLLIRYRAPQGDGVIGILGPTRMDYETNIAMLESLTDLLEPDKDRE